MMPLGDDNSMIKQTPLVTYGLILANILFFLIEMAGGEAFILKWAFIPSEFLSNPIAHIPNLFAAMFMHAGWAHLIGNMLYLWIFGDNVEDRMGKVKFLLFYLFCGFAATMAQVYSDPQSNIPNLGASGAIGGVLGAYLILFPKGTVKVLILSSLVRLPALIVIGFWFVLQFMSSVSPEAKADGEGGVAYMAHVGGFLTGFLLALLVRLTGGTDNNGKRL